jgi:hypothetical protein
VSFAVEAQTKVADLFHRKMAVETGVYINGQAAEGRARASATISSFLMPMLETVLNQAS